MQFQKQRQWSGTNPKLNSILFSFLYVSCWFCRSWGYSLAGVQDNSKFHIIKCLKGNQMGSAFGSFGVHHYSLLSNVLKVWLEYTVIDILTQFGRVYGEITCFFPKHSKIARLLRGWEQMNRMNGLMYLGSVLQDGNKVVNAYRGWTDLVPIPALWPWASYLNALNLCLYKTRVIMPNS